MILVINYKLYTFDEYFLKYMAKNGIINLVLDNIQNEIYN